MIKCIENYAANTVKRCGGIKGFIFSASAGLLLEIHLVSVIWEFF